MNVLVSTASKLVRRLVSYILHSQHIAIPALLYTYVVRCCCVEVVLINSTHEVNIRIVVAANVVNWIVNHLDFDSIIH